MKNTDNLSLIVKKEGFFSKIYNFIANKFFQFKINIFKKKNEVAKENAVEQIVEKKVEKETSFKNLEIDNTWLKLKNIQEELNKKGINEENLNVLLKDLTVEEKEQLKNMYIEQNSKLEQEIENYKRKIIAIKSEL
ncbi:MAG: hypothetical protein J6J60_07450 [Clostridia bacterium]|nr:hypothetical protein [Clostridia bacterium]